MSQDLGLADRYARALYIVTEKRGETALALTDLRGAWEAIRPGTPAGRLLATPLVLLSDKRKVVQEVLEGRALKSVALFIDLLLRKKRVGELTGIVSEFEALVERKEGVQRAQVASAVPLTESELKKLHAEIERMTGKKIKLTAEVDSRLLGGALVRIGDRVIDRSVRTLLAEVEHKLLETSV
jgi:F-type H+-transporting ATPase subunit delta